MPDAFGSLMAGSISCYVVDNLIGIPSIHYQPLFAQEVTRAVAAFRPTVIALEMPAGVRSELEWGLTCWPSPVGSLSHKALFPFVPGDSILEGYRIGRALGIEIDLVDIHLSEATRVSDHHVDSTRPWPGPELANVGKVLFLQIVQGLLQSPGETSLRDQVREAYMAARITRLMRSHERVMWIGGMAHWRNIVERIRKQNLEAPTIGSLVDSAFQRFRLSASALYRMTQRLPYLVSAYAADPSNYNETSAMQAMAVEALDVDARSERTFIVSVPGTPLNRDNLVVDPERASPIDAARVLLFARNLALTTDFRERPTFGELLTAAAGVIDPYYSGRLYVIAMQENNSLGALEFRPLEYDVREEGAVYFSGQEILDVDPWLPSQLNERALTITEVRKRSSTEIFKDLPSRGRGKTIWRCYPPDWERYESFVNYLMRRASISYPENGWSAPFTSGMRDGLDVRATLRHWTEDKVRVRERTRGHLRFTNSAIDWTNTSEHSPILTGATKGGWIDPSQTHLGSCSRTIGIKAILETDPHVQLDQREFSLLTLDLPTSARGPEGKASESFYNKVIYPLVTIQETKDDNLYGWLKVMFKFCTGKPFAYYSYYVPSPKLYRIAWLHDVELVHFPLQRIPEALRRGNRVFRFMSLTARQWEELQRRRAAAAGTWNSPARS